MESTSNFNSIIAAEAEERKACEQFVSISKKILDIQNQVNNREVQYVKYQRELHDLKNRYYKSLVDKNVQETKLDMLKRKLAAVTEVYQKNKQVLEEQRNMVWREMESYIAKTTTYLDNAERNARVKKIVMDQEKNAEAKCLQEKADKRKLTLRMKGELEGMQTFKQGQDIRIKELSSNKKQ